MWNIGFKQALEVGSIVEQLLPKEVSSNKTFDSPRTDFMVKEWYYIEALQNCREQGITIWIPMIAHNYNLTFYVCHNRHSDKIGYYVGDHTFHGVEEGAYKAGFNSFNSVEECAKNIADYIIKYVGL